MLFRILGPVEICSVDGEPVPAGGPLLRTLLAVLLLDPGRVVPTDRLIEALYPRHRPADASNALHSQISRLRRRLLRQGAGVRIEAHPAGYRLTVAAEQVDAGRFGQLARAGQQALTARDHPGAATLLRAALGLWRGDPLAGITDLPFAAAALTRLTEQRMAAVENRVEADLALGGAPALAAELRELIPRSPPTTRCRNASDCPPSSPASSGGPPNWPWSARCPTPGDWSPSPDRAVPARPGSRSRSPARWPAGCASSTWPRSASRCAPRPSARSLRAYLLAHKVTHQ